jgi:hypothetical protein
MWGRVRARANQAHSVSAVSVQHDLDLLEVKRILAFQREHEPSAGFERRLGWERRIMLGGLGPHQQVGVLLEQGGAFLVVVRGRAPTATRLTGSGEWGGLLRWGGDIVGSLDQDLGPNSGCGSQTLGMIR